MKVLLGWELGAGQGHIQRLTAIAQSLQSYGCVPIFALKSYALKGMEFSWQRLLAPRLPFSGRTESYTFADILATFGFDQLTLLRQHLAAWQEILTTVQPDLIITDHAPGLVLAARGRVQTIVIGSHFAVPPPVEEFPQFRFPAPLESAQRQAQVSETVRAVTGLDVPLGQALNGDRSFIFSLPQLDCYYAWRTNPQYVSVHIAPLPPGNTAAKSGTWAYLEQKYSAYTLIRETLHPRCEFKPLEEMLPQTNWAIHHGGLTTTIACLLSGVPQLILPRHVEQQLTGYALASLGVAHIMTKPTWENLLLAQAQQPHLAHAATQLAQDLSPWNQNFIEKLVKSLID
ncbi:glycosyltransferase [Pantanalinema rosaneae CENA516]|uniref:glycosyltransferase n=1 Tax=Pantanalinema rosaneae TaxID=1620701 RepID=UPI003D6FD762